MFSKLPCAFLLVLFLAAPSFAEDTYLVAYAGFAGFQAPVWAPKDLGLFEKYGFKGDTVLVPGSVRQIQAVLGGSIHLAQIDAATGINAINQGADLVMISGTLNQLSIQLCDAERDSQTRGIDRQENWYSRRRRRH